MSATRWAFLGAGFIASRALAPAVHAADGAVLQVAASRDAGRAAALEPVRAVTDYAAAVTAADVDAVYIALPNDDHVPWVLRALAAGKHVLCEKPLGRDLAEVEQVAAAAEGADRLVVEAAWNRWHPRMHRLAELAAGAGPLEVDARFTFPSVAAGNYRLDPAKGGGALLDVGCYTVAAALLALGPGVPEVVQAEQLVGPTGVDLTTRAELAHPAGRAMVRASFAEPERQVLRVSAPGLDVDVAGSAFTSWRAASALHVVDGGAARVEQFAPCDAYQLMVQAVSARTRGEPAWVLPLAESARVAGVLDSIAAAARPVAPADPAEGLN